MTSTPSTSSIAERIAAVQQRIEAACRRAGRDPAEVMLVAVSKTHDLPTLREAASAGLRTFGENRVQEFVPKARAARAEGLALEWHFIGHLQRNKVRDALPYIDLLHSLDSARLAEEIERRTPEARPGRPLPCYVEVNIAGEVQKGGVTPEELPALLEVARASEALAVLGLMTVAPRVVDPEATRPTFVRLRELAATHGLAGLSMGMTDDFEVAIEEGATVVRVGRAIFGERTL